MTITITIKTDNAAFEEDRDQEVARILKEWANRITEDGYGTLLYDFNGNKVGDITVRGIR